jgi:hypothetical protein
MANIFLSAKSVMRRTELTAGTKNDRILSIWVSGLSCGGGGLALEVVALEILLESVTKTNTKIVPVLKQLSTTP